MRAVSAGVGLALLCGCNGLPPASLDSFVIGPQRASLQVAMRERTSHDLEPGPGGSTAGNLKQTGKPDVSRINVEQVHEVKDWSDKFGVSREQLRKVVESAGPRVTDAEHHLNR